MKTPKQWFDEMKERPCVTENDLLVFIKRIQDDARESNKNKVINDWLSQALNEGDGVYRP